MQAAVGADDVEETPCLAAAPADMPRGIDNALPEPLPSLQPEADAQASQLPAAIGDSALDQTAKRRRVIRVETIPDWGGFRLTWVPGGRGAWQAKCCYHRANLATECTKRLSVAVGEDPEKTLEIVKGWCLQAALHTRKRDHGAVRPRLLPEMPSACLDTELERMPPPPVPLKTDDELGAEDDDRAKAAAQHAGDHGKPKRRAKAKSKQAVKAFDFVFVCLIPLGASGGPRLGRRI